MSRAGTMDDIDQEESGLGEDKGEGGTVTAKSNARGQKNDECKKRIGGKSLGENKEEGLKERRKEETMKKERRKREDTESGSKEDKVKSGSNNKEEEVKSGRQEEVLEMRVEEEDEGAGVRDDKPSEKKF